MILTIIIVWWCNMAANENLLKTTIRTKSKKPEEVFCKLEHGKTLSLINNNELNVFFLNISNNKFSYADMFDLLKDNLGSYVLSRNEYGKNPERAITKAISKLREIKNNGDYGAGGELGELILYVFLEYYLNAPKILSKVELKTTKNQYVYNADGIHFYQFEKDGCKFNHLVIGESKLKNKLKDAIDEAFNSIIKSKINDKYDIDLINAEIFKETMTIEETEELKSLIIPHATDDVNNNTIKEKAFGILIGSDIKINDSVPKSTQRQELIKSLNKTVDEIVKRINLNIETHNLKGYSFYVYFLPFNDTTTDKSKIMEQLLIEDFFKEV